VGAGKLTPGGGKRKAGFSRHNHHQGLVPGELPKPPVTGDGPLGAGPKQTPLWPRGIINSSRPMLNRGGYAVGKKTDPQPPWTATCVKPQAASSGTERPFVAWNATDRLKNVLAIRSREAQPSATKRGCPFVHVFCTAGPQGPSRDGRVAHFFESAPATPRLRFGVRRERNRLMPPGRI